MLPRVGPWLVLVAFIPLSGCRTQVQGVSLPGPDALAQPGDPAVAGRPIPPKTQALLDRMVASANRVRSIQGHFLQVEVRLPLSDHQRADAKGAPFSSANLHSRLWVGEGGRLGVDETHVHYSPEKAFRERIAVWYDGKEGGRQKYLFEDLNAPPATPSAPVAYAGMDKIEPITGYMRPLGFLSGRPYLFFQFPTGRDRGLDPYARVSERGWQDLGDEILGTITCRHVAEVRVEGEGGERRHQTTIHLWLAPELGDRWVRRERIYGSPSDREHRVVEHEVAVVTRFEQVNSVWMPVQVREAQYSPRAGALRCSSQVLHLAASLRVNEPVPAAAFAPTRPDGLDPYFTGSEAEQARKTAEQLEAALDAGLLPAELQG